MLVPRQAVQGAEDGPGQGVLDVHAVRVVALLGVHDGQGRAADRLPGFDHAAPGHDVVEYDAAALGVGGTGRGDQVGHVPFGRDRGGLPRRHGARRVGGQHAQLDQLQHAPEPGHVGFGVTPVAARFAAVRADVVAAVPRAQG